MQQRACTLAGLLDYFIKQTWWDGEVKLLCGLEVDDQLEFGECRTGGSAVRMRSM
jgi:hypothetical protein